MKQIHQETGTFNRLHSFLKYRALRFYIQKQLIGFIVCTASVVATNSANAACQWWQNNRPAAPAKLTSNAVMSPTTIQFPSNQAVGTVIASASFTQPGSSSDGGPVVQCQGTHVYSSTPLRGAGSGEIFPSGVPGIGVKISRSSPTLGNIGYFPASPYTNNVTTSGNVESARGYTIKVELVTTSTSSTGGTIAAGAFVQEALGGLAYHDAGLANAVRILPGGDNGGGGPVDPVTPPPSAGRCYPEYTLSRNYTLKPIKVAELKGIGSTTGEISFRVFIACDNASVVPSYFTFTDAADSSNRTSIFKLSPSSKAKDVSIQMTLAKEDTPVKFGVESRQKNNPNNVFLIKNGAAASVDMKARYIQTGPSPSPGKIQASAYITYSLP